MLEEFRKKRQMLKRLHFVAKKVNLGLSNDDFNIVFTKEELFTIAELSASKMLILNRELREMIKNAEEELEQCKIEMEEEIK